MSAMLKKALLAVTVLLGFIACPSCTCTGAADAERDVCRDGAALAGAEGTEAEREIFRQLGDARRRLGLEEFMRQEAMDKSARRQSAAMACMRAVFHQNPDAAVRDLTAGGDGGRSFRWAENVGVVPVGNVKGIGHVSGPADAGRALVRLWMESAGHRANIADGGFGKIGVGVVRDGAGSYYGTVIFRGP